MCPDCGVRRLGRYLCERHGLEEKPEEEEILYRAEDREALNYQRYLARQGVTCRVFSTDRDAGLLLGGGAAEAAEAARIIVPSKHRKPTLKWMAARSIDVGHVLFQCACCSALNGFDSGVCTNCGGH